MKKLTKLLLITIILGYGYTADINAQEGVSEVPSKETIETFYEAINADDTLLITDYIKNAKYPINYKPQNIISPLGFAVKKNRITVLRILLENNFILTNEELGSVIYECAEYNKPQTANHLLSYISHKEILNFEDWKDKYPQEVRGGNLYVIYRLIVAYALDFIQIINTGEQRLDFFIAAVENKDYEILNLLDFKDEALNLSSCYGYTVLTMAVYKNDIEMVKYLLNKGVDKEKRELPACYDEAREGWNAYEIAEHLGYKKIMELLK